MSRVETCDLCIVGAGPAGLSAAAAAKEKAPGISVLVLDRMERAGNKIYATGNGRCNLTNLRMESGCYFSDSAEDPLSFLGGIREKEVCAFFARLGVSLVEKNGYVYPATEQAASIALPLVHRAEDLGAKICTGVRVTGIEKTKDGHFLLHAEAQRREKKGKEKCSEALTVRAGAVLLACGGIVSRAFGDEGDGAGLAERLGHRITPCFPALTFLATSAPGTKVLAGARVEGACTLFADGKKIAASEGEIQFTEGALSGIPFFQISHAAGRALSSGARVEAEVNFLPKLSPDPEALLSRRLALVPPHRTAADLFTGILNSRAASFLLRKHGIAEEKKLRGLSQEDLLPVFQDLFACSFPVTGLGPADRAQVTAGGVFLSEADPDTLASLRCRGLFLAGEVLDIDGICGGYNLTFAFSSGLRAGEAAAAFLAQPESKPERERLS